jgi:GTP cyclohydrolase I
MKGSAIHQQRIEKAVSAILEAIGEDPQREGLRETPQRVARMCTEIFSGIGLDPAAAIDTVFEATHHHPVVLRDVPFFSICEHHLLPFTGLAHMGYIPNGRIAGLSKLARALEVVARRPQVQERLTQQLADAIFTALTPKGVVVEVEAEHLCMSMRGVKKPGSRVITTAIRGGFEECELDRENLLAMIRRR